METFFFFFFFFSSRRRHTRCGRDWSSDVCSSDLEIDGKPVSKSITTDDVFKLLRGPSGTTVEVTIEREDEAEPLKLTIERAKIPIESVYYPHMIRPGVGYVRIT